MPTFQKIIMGFFKIISILSLLLILTSGGGWTKGEEWKPCIEFKRDMQVACKCMPTTTTSSSSEYSQSFLMDCDGVIFTKESLETLRDQSIISISQRNSGLTKIPQDLFNISLSLEKLDLSNNFINRLMDRYLSILNNLKELKLNDNLLGDNLNPIFSSNEFHDLKELKILHLNKNGLRSLEEGIFKGCINLQELYLDDNNFTLIPAESLKGPKAIRIISLAGNNIASLSKNALKNLDETLLRLDLSRNEIFHIEDNTLINLNHLLFLNISRNQLIRFNSDVFKGAYNLLQLDISINFLQEFPTDALRHLNKLKFLNISNNLITEIERIHLSGLNQELQVLDLSRNNIGRLGVNAFSNLTSLTRLDLSLNALRTVEESSFQGLIKLKWLSLQDNNILLIPAGAIGRLPSLLHLHIEFNRIAALPNDLIKLMSNNIISLGITRNVVREIPSRMFINFNKLTSIELSGNILSTITQHTFAGLENTLLNLDLSNNRLITISSLQLNNLISLNLASNHLKRLNPDNFNNLIKLKYLNISNNPLYGGFPPVFPGSLTTLDASKTGLKILPTVLLLNLNSLTSLYLSNNHLQELNEGTFQNMYNLTTIDLSYNIIDKIDNGAFINIINLYKLNLKGNRLNRFAGEYFNTGTGLQILDLSFNSINYLSPTAFIIHPRLKEIYLNDNEFIHFPSELIKPLQFLEYINLSNNNIKIINEFSFSQMKTLRQLYLINNKIEFIDDLAFHNSTQLQIIDLSNNIIENLNERTFEGLLRLQLLNLNNNKLKSLPETIFDQMRIRIVEKIDLSNNNFIEIPIGSLKRQSTNIYYLNMSKNKLIQLYTQEIINNVKYLDLSYNPLNSNSIKNILGDAKILRYLNLANTGIENLADTIIETPFLKYLNLSGNNINNIQSIALERSTLLEILDLSNNKLQDFSILPNTLKYLDISGNNFKHLNQTSFHGLNKLKTLKMSNLLETIRIDKNTFQSLNKLEIFIAYNYPRLGYFDIQGILKNMINLKIIDIEIKDSTVGNDLLSINTHPRINYLTLRGERLKNILSSAFVGIKNYQFQLGFQNTSIDSLPAALFFPIPRSTQLHLDISGSKFTTISSQLISALEERNGMVKLYGIENNPISCDCQSKSLWKWLRLTTNTMPIRCSSPQHLFNKFLIDLNEEMLSCDNIIPTKYPINETTIQIEKFKSTSSEPEIIWTVAPTFNNKFYPTDMPPGSPITNATTDDTLIIGIVGGVVAFIAIIIIIICICRLKWTNQINQTQMTTMASNASVFPSAKKINQEAYVNSYNGSTLGHHHNRSINNQNVQIMPYVQPLHVMHPHSPQPIYGYYGENHPLPVYMCTSDDR